MPIWDLLFGRSMTPQERLRQHLRTLQRARRELDRERSKLETQEKQLIADIKRNARQGQMPACKVMARDLVRTRRNIHKFYQMSTQLQAVALRMQTLRSTQQMGDAMRGATRALGSMNRSMNIVAVQRILQEFERESSSMDMKDEMMSDAVDDVMGDAEADEMGEGVGEGEASDAILREVLDEIGVDMSQKLSNVPPSGTVATPAAAPAARVPIGETAGGGDAAMVPPPSGGASGGASDDAALQARLDKLRNL